MHGLSFTQVKLAQPAVRSMDSSSPSATAVQLGGQHKVSL
jgi:hypothetical protein